MNKKLTFGLWMIAGGLVTQIVILLGLMAGWWK